MSYAIKLLNKEKEKIINQSFIDANDQSKLFEINQALEVLQANKGIEVNDQVKIFSFIRSNSKMVKITLTELRNLIFYATLYLESSKPKYCKDNTFDFIRNNSHLMPMNKMRYKKLERGSRYSTK